MRFIFTFIFCLQAALTAMPQDSASTASVDANATPQEAKPLLNFLKYGCKTFQPSCTLDYTPGWIINEMSGEAPGTYELMLTEPKHGIEFRANFKLISMPLQRKEIKADLFKIIARIAYKYQADLAAEMDTPKIVGFTSFPAWEVTYTYRGVDPFRSGLPEDVCRRMIIYRYGNTAMIFYYENSAANMKLYNRLFEYTLLSLEFNG